MKKHLLFLFALIVSVVPAFTQTNCNAGFETPIFAFTTTYPANTLFAIRVTAASAGTLTDISIYNSGLSQANIKLAVYDDNAGLPGNLIASTGPVALTTTAGVITTAVTPVVIPAGDYYLAGVLDVAANSVPYDNTTTLTLYGAPMPFATSFPANGSGFGTVPGSPVNIWMNITCSPSGLPEVAGNPSFAMNCYPSPVNDNCNLVFNSSSSQEVFADVYNCSGQVVNSQTLNIPEGESTSTLEMADLVPGIYFLALHDAAGNIITKRKLIKA